MLYVNFALSCRLVIPIVRSRQLHTACLIIIVNMSVSNHKPDYVSDRRTDRQLQQVVAWPYRSVGWSVPGGLVYGSLAIQNLLI